PAFWMLGADFGQVGWPNSGEIDILEYVGAEPQTTYGTIHGPGYSGASGVGSPRPFDVDVADDYHVFGIEWDPNVIRWYVDGELFNTVTPDALVGRPWVFDHDFFLILNVAVGGYWPGNPDETTVFPQQMAVDWVRVYQRAAPEEAPAADTDAAPLADPLVADFEGEINESTDEHGNGIGYIPWGDAAGNVVLEAVVAEGDLAHPDQADGNTVLNVAYDIGAWGGFSHIFTDGATWLTQNWSGYTGLDFWLYGANSGGVIQVEIFDNRAPDATTDSAERWFYQITDDFEGWQHFSIPFTDFQRRADWQPGGAPDDGLGLTEVHGYAFGFPAGVGAQVNYLDDVSLSNGN
ncbi:MAG: family 16 glycosylhydrolase, partial [Anaerolineae bacterium]|nr:family 16 glycosylhydrolase [Anaerolineae bacterium]